MIEISYLKELLEIFDASSVHDLRIEQEGVEIRLSKSPREGSQVQTLAYAPMPMAPQPPAATAAPAALPAETPQSAPAESEPAKKLHEIRSPIVGTFYRSPNPEAPPFVEVGQSVSPGMVLCIVEAMKLMNEIECDAFGKVAKVMVENAQPVEYNQLLFVIEQE